MSEKKPLAGDLAAYTARGAAEPVRCEVLGRTAKRVRICLAGRRAVSCLTCARIGGLRGDPRRGWCLEFRQMRSGTFPVLCPKYVKASD